MERGSFSGFTIIIPTLNEANNIGRLIAALAGRYKGVHIIVSDDGSRDGTREEVLEASGANSNILLFDHSKFKEHGLTASVVDAARLVKTEYVIVMDGDLQHPPEVVGKIAAGLRKSDLCIGVRTQVKNWGLHRIILSKGISYIVYLVFRIRGKATCSDMMSGFFGIRAEILERLARRNRKGFVLDGYKVLLDILRMLDKNARIFEVGYPTFHPRNEGRSKLRIKHMIEVLVSAFR